ncbi:MAG: ABC transporter ATP-binding protein, partial [Armatimonadetes bacterium]|nr:ABC transporter ATP-binding protein [Armatimonadota bacterium]
DALSGGQQQRVALARATALQPGLLLLDEPLSNLDARLRVETRTMLRAVQRELGATAVYVTHDQEEALTLSDRIVVMRGGRIVQVGTPRELYDQPCCEYVATFLGRANLLPVTTTAGRVRLADGLVVPYPPARDSGPALLCIRPEAVRVGEVGDLPATVAGTVFNGPWIEYQLDVLGARWQAIEANRRQPWRAVGQRVALELPPEAITLLPPDAS